MADGRRADSACPGTPPQVWTSLSGERRTQVIVALARLAVQWVTAQASDQLAHPREVHDGV
jgi:hypothetical protein